MQRLEVPYEKKDEVKRMGARWNMSNKCWECSVLQTKKFDRFLPVYLDVPFADKDEVKALGAKWDFNAKKWKVAKYQMTEELQKYVDVSKVYLTVPFKMRTELKQKGACWDATAKKWYFFSCQPIPHEFDEFIEGNENESDECVYCQGGGLRYVSEGCYSDCDHC